MRVNYLDLGLCLGIELVWMARHFLPTLTDDYHAYGFDAHIGSCEKVQERADAKGCKNTTILHKAVAKEAGTIKLFLSDNPYSHSIYDTKKNVNPDKFETVEAVRISDFLRDNTEEGDFNILRFNIEGAEWDLINDLIDSGMLPRVDLLFGAPPCTDMKKVGELKDKVPEMLALLEEHDIKIHIFHCDSTGDHITGMVRQKFAEKVAAQAAAVAQIETTPKRRTFPGIKYVVTTAATNGYDRLREISKRDDRFRYIAFTDTPCRNVGWEVYPIDSLNSYEEKELTPRMQARLPKMRCLEIFPDAEIVIWLDAHRTIDAYDLLERVEAFGDAGFYANPHPTACGYKESIHCEKTNHYPLDQYKPQRERMRADGFPDMWGMRQGNILVYRRTPKTEEFAKMWWDETLAGCPRDQVSMPYCLWKTGLDQADIGKDFLASLTFHGRSGYPSYDPETDQSSKALTATSSLAIDSSIEAGHEQALWYRLASAFVHEGDSVLDIGCGLGREHGNLYANQPSLLVGCDTQDVSDLVEIQGPGHEIWDMDRALLRQFDVVTVFDVLNEVPDDIAFMRTVRRTTKKACIISVPNKHKGSGRPNQVRQYAPNQFESVIRAVFPDKTILLGSASKDDCQKCLPAKLNLNSTLHRGQPKYDWLAAVIIM